MKYNNYKIKFMKGGSLMRKFDNKYINNVYLLFFKIKLVFTQSMAPFMEFF